MFIAISINALSRKGTRPSIPQAANDLLALRQSYICNLSNLRTVSSWNSFAEGALWKYKYPPKISSAPSPESTILIPIALIALAIKYIGVDARIVVMS